MEEQAIQTEDFSELMTPEELQLLKELQEKKKKLQKSMHGLKEKFFQDMTENFASSISGARKDIITISTKEPLEDGNVWAITFGIDDDSEGLSKEQEQDLAKKILQENMTSIEQLIGISNSLKVNGEYKGKKLFWQFRKREKE